MAIIVKYEVSGMDSTKYDGIMRDSAAAGLEHPEGRRFHVAYGERSGLQVIDVFDSPRELEAFGGKLMPILAKYSVSARPEVLGAQYNTVLGK